VQQPLDLHFSRVDARDELRSDLHTQRRARGASTRGVKVSSDSSVTHETGQHGQRRRRRRRLQTQAQALSTRLKPRVDADGAETALQRRDDVRARAVGEPQRQQAKEILRTISVTAQAALTSQQHLLPTCTENNYATAVTQRAATTVSQYPCHSASCT
jgi:hypothetical protein